MAENKKLYNKSWALVLGGSSGLGLASAKKLAKEGYNICVVHRDRRSVMDQREEDFQEIKSLGVQFLSFNVDALNDEKRLEVLTALKEKMGEGESLRTLIFSIARGNLKPMIAEGDSSLTNDDFHMTIESMAISLYAWVKAVFEAGLFAEDSRIISFTSEGNRKVWKNYAAVSAAKAALESISRSVALEFAPFGIRSNCIQAGMTDTESFRMIPGNEALKNYTLSRNPFQRMTTPEDVANVVFLLCSPEAAWINGAVIPVDGGEQNQ